MGYFSNSTEQMDYHETYCRTCVHIEDCAVMNAHFLMGYEECDNEKSILHMLIPFDEDGDQNEKCLMHFAKHPQGDE